MKHRAVLCTLAGALALGWALSWTLTLHAGQAPGGKYAAAAQLSPLRRESVPVKFADGAQYAGSASCQSCHAQEFAQWLKSGHANMLRPVSPDIVLGAFDGQEIVYDKVEVEGADKQKVSIAPKVRPERKGDKFFVTLLDADNPANNRSYEVVEVLGSLWEQQYYLKVGDKVFPSPIRWVDKDKQWRKAAFRSIAFIWWLPDGTPDGRPRTAAEMPAKETVEYGCNGCHTTGHVEKKDDATGTYAFSRAEASIGCEACHGPGSAHVASPVATNIVNPGKLGTTQQLQICGRCHSRVNSKKDKDVLYQMGFQVGQTDLQDRAEFWTYNTKPVAWPNEDAKKNRQQYHDISRGAHQGTGMTCNTCHLTHATDYIRGTLRQPREQQCVGCHGAQQAMFEGSAHAAKGFVCVDCHMSKMANRAGATAKTPKDPWDVTAHTMRVVTPVEAEAFKMRSSCDACHGDAGRAAAGRKMQEGREAVVARLAEAQAAMARTKAPEAQRLKAQAKLDQVLLDGSRGAHNPQKALVLLDGALKDLKGK